jgi:hypothetical protein
VLSLDGTNDYVTISVGTTTSSNSSQVASLSFDGADDYVRIPNAVLNGLSSGTIEAWVYLDANGFGTITSKQHDGANTTGVFTIGTPINSGAPAVPGQLYFHAFNDANANSTATVPTSGWHHVAVSFNSSSVQFYIDGQAVGTTVTQNTQGTNFGIPNLSSPGVTNIGAFGHGSLSNALDGKIAEVRIWQDVRTATEIADNYNKQLAGNESDLKAYYRLDSSSQTVTDQTGHGYNGTLAGDTNVEGNDPALNASGPTLTASVTTPDINLGPSVAFTLEAWIKTAVAADGTIRTILAKSETGSWQSGSKLLAINGTGKLFFETNGGSGTIVGTSTVSDGEWHHVAFTYSSGTGTIYVDGVAETSGAITLPADDPDHEIFIGSHTGGGQYFAGQIDEVRIWSTARDAGQIRDGMAEKYDFDETGLKAQYSFEDGATNSANAYNTTTQDGTFTNGATTTDSGSGDPIIVHPPATALDFDGTNDTVAMGAAIAPTGSSARTFMLWAKTSSTAEQTFLSYGSAASSQAFGFGLNGYTGGSQGVTIDIWGAAITFQPLTATSDGQWHHYAVVLPSGGNSLRDLQVYQDGILLSGIAVLATGDVALNTSAASSFTLGTFVDGTRDFSGQMSDVSVWSTGLTAAQIRDYATNGLAGTESGLTALWHLDEGTGTTVNDVAGAATNGTISGATWVDGAPDVDGNFLQIVENGSANGRMTAEDISGTPSYSLFDGPDHGTMQLNSVTGEWTYVPNSGYQGDDSFTLRATGGTAGIDDEVVSIKIGEQPTINPTDSVLSLDGSTGHVDVGTLDNLTGAMTIEAWIKWDGAGAVSGVHDWARIVDFAQGQDDDNILLAANGGSGELAFDIRIGASNSHISTVVDMPLNEWIHVAATTNGTTGSLYINGVLQTLQQGGTSAALNTAANVSRTSSYIGESNWATESTSDFQITDVRVWNVERTATQISENYDRRLNGDETGLYSYWRLDEGSGHVAIDSSGNGHDGVIVGGATYASQTQIEITGGSAYKGLILGSDGDHDNLSYSVALADGGAPDHGTFSFDASNNTYTYDPVNTYSGDDSVTINVTDDHNQTTQHTIQFHMA